MAASETNPPTGPTIGMAISGAMERRLLAGGYRLTAPRRALIEAMQDLGERFTAEELVADAPTVGRATVFRTLRLLQDLGLVCQVVLPDGGLEYRIDEAGHHHHLVCTECGAIGDFSGCDIDDLLAELARRTGYDIDRHRLEVYGRCARCTAAVS